MITARRYTARLKMGSGLIDETLALLELWESGLTAAHLTEKALASGRFPNMTARSLKNIVFECFAPRYLSGSVESTTTFRTLSRLLPRRDLLQLMLLQTARANPMLGDFIRTVYWPAYAAGRETISSEDSAAFVRQAIADGHTDTSWSESTANRVASGLTGCCADFGLLEAGRRSERHIMRVHPTPTMAVYLAYSLHFTGIGDNTLLQHEDWGLYGLSPQDVLDELNRHQRNGHFMVQSAGDLVRITWTYSDWEALGRALTQV